MHLIDVFVVVGSRQFEETVSIPEEELAPGAF